MPPFAVNHWHHHARFYIAAIAGALAYAVAVALKFEMPPTVASDVFFLTYLLGFALAARGLGASALRKRAQVEDEGRLVVSVLIIAVIAYYSWTIFTTLNASHRAGPVWLVLTLIGAPLGWFVVHTNEALHYSNLYYGRKGVTAKEPVLDFNEKIDPGIWEFLYFSFVIGMTAQTSDVEIRTTPMRRAVLVHSLISYFFTTVLIAVAVNAAVSKAG